VRRHRWLILLITLVFAGAAVAYSLRQPTVYEAEASIAFQDPAQELDVLGTPVTPTSTPEVRAAEGAVAVLQPAVLKRVVKRLDLDESVASLKGRLTTLAEARTNFVVVQAEGPTADEAASLANEVARQARAVETLRAREGFEETARVQRRALERAAEQAVEEDPVSRTLAEDRIARIEALANVAQPVEVVSQATPPDGPVSPRPVRNGLLGGLLGLTLGIVAAFVRDSLDQRLRNARQIEEHMGLPLVGSVSANALGKTSFGTNGKRKLSSLDVEASRILRSNLEFLDVDQPPRSFLVTSGLPEEGKSTVAASLAYASAAAGKTTLLLECDLRRPALAERLGLEPRPGVTECLAAGQRLETVVRRVTTDSPLGSNGAAPGGGGEPAPLTFDCVVAGAATPRPAELLGSQRFEELLDEAHRTYDCVVIDSSPLLSVADTLAIIPRVDAVLVCVRSARTTQDEARAARSALEKAPVRPTALVVTGVRPGEDAAYGHYSYAYAYGQQRVR
jgi:Mrp family chromosome partitioning ATPase/capsular polysaccharide biosynthesis protein